MGLSDQGILQMRENVQKILMQRSLIITSFKTIKFFGSILGDNNANFVLVQVVHNETPSNSLALKIYNALARIEGFFEFKLGVVVRYRGMETHCMGCLRVTVGTQNENEFLLEKLNGKVISDIVSKE